MVATTLLLTLSGTGCEVIWAPDRSKIGTTSTTSTRGTGGSHTSSGSGGHAGGTTTSTSTKTKGCSTDSDCDDMNPCTTDACNQTTGACSHAPVPEGNPPVGYIDLIKDCKTEACLSGMLQTVAADSDVPPSGNPCVIDSCKNQAVVMTNAMSGQSCGPGNQVCDNMGHCVGCNKDGDCTPPGTCKSVACTNSHMCVVSNSAIESPCMGSGKVCDGKGNCVVCASNADCTSGACQGGACTPLANGQPCQGASQCQSGWCYGMPSPACQADSCGDGATDGTETDVDCGGGTCPPCANGQACAAATDCTSGACDATAHTCAANQCSDHIKDGAETDVDCGGGTCPPCATGQMCVADTDCMSGCCDASNHCT
jgi:hypothetical protein